MTDSLWWYGSIYFWMLMTGIGLPPVPEEVGIISAVSASQLHSNVWWPLAWLATSLGIISADLILYAIGRKYGVRLFEYQWMQRFLKKEKRIRLENRFHQHGFKFLLLSRLLPPLRTGVFLIAGAARYSLLKFIIADAVYGVVGVGIFFLFGSWIIGILDGFKHWLSQPLLWVIVTPLLIVAGYLYFRRYQRREKLNIPMPADTILNAVGATTPAEVPDPNLVKTLAAAREADILFKD